MIQRDAERHTFVNSILLAHLMAVPQEPDMLRSHCELYSLPHADFLSSVFSVMSQIIGRSPLFRTFILSRHLLIHAHTSPDLH